jgi:hypothetical protein
VRGEIAWPGGLLTVLAWILIGIALVLSSANFSRVPIGMRLGAAEQRHWWLRRWFSRS